MKVEFSTKVYNIILSLLLLVIIIGAMFMIFFKNEEVAKIITEPIYKEREIVKRILIPGKKEYDTIYMPNDTITIEGEVNKDLAAQLYRMKDSIQLLHAYIDAIKIRRYTGTVEDEYVKIDYWATTTGTLDSMEMSHVIKSREIEFPVKKEKAKFLIGPGLISSYRDFKPRPTLGAAYQSKKGDLFSLDVSTKEEVFFTYKTNLFK